MELSESDSTALLTNGEEPKLDSNCAPAPPQPSDLTHAVIAIQRELQSKLDLKDEDKGGAETADKVSDDEGGVETADKISDGGGAEAADKVMDKGGAEAADKVTDKGGAETADKVSDDEGGAKPADKVSDFNDGGKSGEKVSDFNDVGEICNAESFAEGYNGDNRGWETNSWNDDVNDEVGFDGVAVGVRDSDEDEDRMEMKDENSGRTHQYPLRPDAEDCAFYMKTGSCKFGFNCKFNHPIRRKNQAVKEKTGEREEPTERSGPAECKYYLKSGGCKFGKSCKYNHTRGKVSTAPSVELNFLGLPIRLGEKECPYYMRTGSCKFGANCKFNHPDPTAVGGGDPPSRYGNGGSIPLKGVSQPSVPSWSSPRTLNETSPFVPMMLPSTPGVPPHNSDWNGYQPTMYLSERGVQPSSFVMNNPSIETNAYMPHQKHMLGSEFPERPGQPECSYFLKTGDCKFKSNCKFHHPKNRIAKLPPCNLSDKGLPLRPDQNVCSHYSRYGICKFGPACKFDHPIDPLPVMTPGLGEQSYSNTDSVEVTGMGGGAAATDETIQQSV